MPTVKKYLQLHYLRSSFVRPLDAWIFWLLLYSILDRSKVTVWQRIISKNIFCNGSFRYVSTLHKYVFSTVSVKFFFFRPQNAQILSFLLILIKERWRVLVWPQKTSKYMFCIESFDYESIKCKKKFSIA